MATATAAVEAAKAAAAQATAAALPIDPVPLGQGGKVPKLIPKPKGSAGGGYLLQFEMGLKDNKMLYNSIVVLASSTYKLLLKFV